MRQCLHLLTSHNQRLWFSRLDIEGDTVVWNEILSDGPLSERMASSEFWRVRQEFHQQSFDIEQTSYQKLTLWEFTRLRALLPDARELLIWHNHSWLHWANIMALLSYLSHLPEVPPIALVSPPVNTSPGKQLQELSEKEINLLWPSRYYMRYDDLQFAQQFWNIYSGSDPNLLLRFIDAAPTAFPRFSQCLTAHLLRFPSVRTGLGLVEELMLRVVSDAPKSIAAVVEAMKREDRFWGLTDLQYYLVFKHLTPFFESITRPRLNARGQALWQGKVCREVHERPDYYLGGAHFPAWELNLETFRLEKTAMAL